MCEHCHSEDDTRALHIDPALLKLRYHGSIPDAVQDLGRPDEIRQVFVGFQKYLYRE